MRNLNLHIPTLDNNTTYVAPVNYPVVYNYPEEIVKAAAALGITPKQFIENQEAIAKQGVISQGGAKSPEEKTFSKEKLKELEEQEKAEEQRKLREQADEIADKIGLWTLGTGLTTLATRGLGISLGTGLLPKIGRKLRPINLSKEPLPWWKITTRNVGSFLLDPRVGTAVDILNPFFKSGGKINYLNLFK